MSPPAATAAAGEAGPPGGPVPRGSRATSVSFISPSTAFVLGSAPCSHAPCSEILRTRDRGRSWRGLPAPRESVSAYFGNGLWGLRFADAQRGYAFGAGLWQTTNGGASWQRADAPAPSVLSLQAVQDRELVALGARCPPGGGECQVTLYRRPIRSGAWTAVARGRVPTTGSLAVHSATVWAAFGSTIYVSTDGGINFHAERSPCNALGTWITDDGSHAYALCTGSAGAGSAQKFVYRSGGPGSAWTHVGNPPLGGGPQGISAGSDGAVMVAAVSGASELYRSADGGHSWRTPVVRDDGGAGWADLGFTTPFDGVVVHGPAVSDGGAGRRGQVLLTEDGGLSWHAVSF